MEQGVDLMTRILVSDSMEQGERRGCGRTWLIWIGTLAPSHSSMPLRAGGLSFEDGHW